MRGTHQPLTKGERVHLARVARDAWTALTRASVIDQPFDDWRHAQAITAAGKTISEATKGDFATLKAHFLAQAGRTAQAFKVALAEESGENATRQARWHLAKELSQAGLDTAYAAEICKDKFKTTLAHASPKQLWSLVYDIRRTARTRRAKPAVSA